MSLSFKGQVCQAAAVLSLRLQAILQGGGLCAA